MHTKMHVDPAKYFYLEKCPLKANQMNTNRSAFTLKMLIAFCIYCHENS